MSWSSPQTWTSGQLVTATDLNREVRDNLLYLFGSMPNLIKLWPQHANIIAGAFTNTMTVDATQQYCFYLQQSAPANANAMELSFIAQAGTTYGLNVVGEKRAGSGIIDIAISDTSGAYSNVVTGQDWYSAAPVVNTKVTNSGITVVGNGYHKLKLTVNGKNAGSANFHMPLTQIYLEVTAF